MANGQQVRTAHFVLHQWQNSCAENTGPGLGKAPALLVEKGLGVVIPKRFAKRAVTRNLIRRQIKELLQREQAHLPPALYVVRLKTPFAKHEFISAASDALKQTVHQELIQLVARLKANVPA